ncbi:hypothetical protein AB4Z34_15645 [Ensifer sp. 2YAB10]|uniref:hypothetical protein n=1 Tax=unclassified Ensifer TaxID=2633371 RepID=UPI000DE542B5
MDNMFEQIAASAVNNGPNVLASHWSPFRRPMDVVKDPVLSVDDKRTILAAWASDFYAIDSKPALRHVPGTPEPVSIDEVRSALGELDLRYDT